MAQALKEVATEILQTGEIALWASEILADRFDQSTEELKALLQLPLSLAEDEQHAVPRRLAEALAAQNPPKALAEPQIRPTENIQGHDRRHNVQENDEKALKDVSVMIIEKFGGERIDSPNSLVWIPSLKHQLITGYYNRAVDTPTGRRLRRQVVGDGDFQWQYQDGLATLRLFGVLQ